MSTLLVASMALTLINMSSAGAQGSPNQQKAAVSDPGVSSLLRSTPKIATQSSTRAGGSAIRAIDGNTNGSFRARSVTHTAKERRPWWQMELTESTNIQSVKVWNRTDNCCSDRLSDFWVLISDKPFASNDLDKLLADPAVKSRRVKNVPNPSATVEFDNVKAKYVRVQLNGENVLSLAEVQVVDSSNPDKDIVTQSSTRAGGVAERAFDENTDGNFRKRSVSHTALESQPWWQVELAYPTDVDIIALYNRTDCCADRLKDYWVLVSQKPFASNDLDVLLADPNVEALRSPGEPYGNGSVYFDFGADQIKYVRVQLEGVGILSLAEVVVQPPT